ncbi:histone-fold-containing protein [Pseudovirgaria hyperparasitica]|uniref:NCT transcriptional regulatory complex subunit A n=1 Tax=Pseudovirgaria hyperparasitica TaxID=470096 RepID=A0A6A6WMJ8_9PEZI|nr:histone-fold-containing protein [Pseudovirgaria hyperparasitica]KAF2763424.1 histone-fold-containing protein [Pseudovirgaria hyperparasitica]
MPPQTRGRRVQYEEDDYTPESPPEPAHDYSSFPPDGNSDSSANTNADLGIIVKTKFPVARIKRIMQADEDVGKVAQVTPVAVSKALELFMINLVTKAASEARSRGQKRVTPAHLKQAITSDTQFDFLEDVVKKIADAPAATEKMDEDESGEPKKRKGAGRRKKKEDSEEL